MYHLEFVLFQAIEEDSLGGLKQWKQLCKDLQVQLLLDFQPVFTSIAEKKQSSSNSFVVFHDERQRQIAINSYLKVDEEQKLSVSLLSLSSENRDILSRYFSSSAEESTRAILNIKQI